MKHLPIACQRLLVYVLNYPNKRIDKLLVEGVLREGAQSDFSILIHAFVFFMSLFVLKNSRPLIWQKQWSERFTHLML